jgi:hypothetical protein
MNEIANTNPLPKMTKIAEMPSLVDFHCYRRITLLNLVIGTTSSGLNSSNTKLTLAIFAINYISISYQMLRATVISSRTAYVEKTSYVSHKP